MQNAWNILLVKTTKWKVLIGKKMGQEVISKIKKGVFQARSPSFRGKSRG